MRLFFEFKKLHAEPQKRWEWSSCVKSAQWCFNILLHHTSQKHFRLSFILQPPLIRFDLKRSKSMLLFHHVQHSPSPRHVCVFSPSHFLHNGFLKLRSSAEQQTVVCLFSPLKQSVDTSSPSHSHAQRLCIWMKCQSSSTEIPHFPVLTPTSLHCLVCMCALHASVSSSHTVTLLSWPRQESLTGLDRILRRQFLGGFEHILVTIAIYVFNISLWKKHHIPSIFHCPQSLHGSRLQQQWCVSN